MLDPIKSLKTKNSNLDLLDSNEYIFDMVIDALFITLIVDRYGTIRHISNRYAEYFNSTPDQLIGKKVEEVIPTTNVYNVLKTGEAELGTFFKLRDGRSLICNRLPIKDPDGTLLGVVCMSSLDTPDINILYQAVKELQIENDIYLKQLRGLNDAPDVMNSIVGTSPLIMDIKKTLTKVTNCSMPILITGESGVGKEVFANAIHQASNRKAAPFVKVNCAAIPKDLLESELFGYEAGTFSGAIKTGKAGKFELANSGTILLDEIEELPLAMQSKMLRVLQEYEVERIGSIKPIPLNLQVICCSNKDLYDMVAKGTFREDLLYRINVMEIEVPPLRERTEDISLLCDSLIQKINNKYKLGISSVSPDGIEYLSSYSWPGNIRELEHALERACAMANDSILSYHDFKFMETKIKKSPLNPTDRLSSHSENFFETKQKTEKELIIATLNKKNQNKTETAKALGISRSLLYTKMRKYNID